MLSLTCNYSEYDWLCARTGEATSPPAGQLYLAWDATLRGHQPSCTARQVQVFLCTFSTKYIKWAFCARVLKQFCSAVAFLNSLKSLRCFWALMFHKLWNINKFRRQYFVSTRWNWLHPTPLLANNGNASTFHSEVYSNYGRGICLFQR